MHNTWSWKTYSTHRDFWLGPSVWMYIFETSLPLAEWLQQSWGRVTQTKALPRAFCSTVFAGRSGRWEPYSLTKKTVQKHPLMEIVDNCVHVSYTGRHLPTKSRQPAFSLWITPGKLMHPSWLWPLLSVLVLRVTEVYAQGTGHVSAVGDRQRC